MKQLNMYILIVIAISYGALGQRLPPPGDMSTGKANVKGWRLKLKWYTTIDSLMIFATSVRSILYADSKQGRTAEIPTTMKPTFPTTRFPTRDPQGELYHMNDTCYVYTIN